MFYLDSSYTTQIVPDSSCLYIDLIDENIYRYDETTHQYIAISGSGGKIYLGGYGIDVNNVANEISAKIFVGTQSEWNNLTSAQKAKFDTVFITDDSTQPDYEPGHVIVDSEGTAAVQRNNLQFDGMTVTDDSTSGTTVVAPIPYTAGDKITITDHEIAVDDTVTTTFTGTRAEWEALTAVQKAQYTIVNLTDDPAGSGMVVVDVIQSGNMNAVTSNAVYNATIYKRITEVYRGTDVDNCTTLSDLFTILQDHVNEPLMTDLGTEGSYPICQLLTPPTSSLWLTTFITLEGGLWGTYNCIAKVVAKMHSNATTGYIWVKYIARDSQAYFQTNWTQLS